MRKELKTVHEAMTARILTVEDYIDTISEQLHRLSIDAFDVDDPIVNTFKTVDTYIKMYKEDEEEFAREVQTLAEEDFFNESIEFSDGNLQEALDAIFEEINRDGPIEYEFNTETNVLSLRTKHRGTLDSIVALREELNNLRDFEIITLESSLISLMTTFEKTARDLLQIQFRKYPGRLHSTKFEKNYKELLKYNTLEDVIEEIELNKIDSIMYKSVREILNEVVAKKEGYDHPLLCKLEEISQRRNIVVHNDAIINDIYINNVEEDYRQNLAVGDKVLLSNDYLENACNTVFKILTSLIYNFWMDRNPQDSLTKFDYFQDRAFELMSKEQDTKALYVYELLRNSIEGQEIRIKLSDELRFNVNYAQCLKWNQQEDELAEFLKTLDMSLAKPTHRMCIAFVKDDYDTGSKLLVELLIENEDDQDYIEDILKWPVLREFRKTPAYNEVLDQAGTTKYVMD